MPAPPLHQLVYSSLYTMARVDSPLSALRDILSVSRKNNQASAVTGFLIFDGDCFVQVLEGTRDSIDTTLARIARDTRHRDTQVIGTALATQRQFADWTMAGYLRSPRHNAIFEAHGFPGKINRAALSFDTALSLALALAAIQTDAAQRPA